MNEIFEKACEEVKSLGTDEKTMERFRSVTQKKWLETFVNNEFPSYEDNKNAGAAKLIDKFVGRDKLIFCSDRWLWQSCIAKTASEGCPYTSFTFLLLADALYQKLGALEDFYKIEEAPNRPYQKFMNGLLTDMAHNYDHYQELDPYLDKVLETGISEPLKKLVVALKEAIPKPEPEPEPQQQPAPAQQVQALALPAAAVPQTVVVQARPEYEQDPFFKVFLLADQLDTICKVVYQDIKKGKHINEAEIISYLQQSLGMPSLRHKFIVNLNILYWYLNKGNEKTIFILRSLWDIVFQLAARDKKDISLDAPQDIVLAMWEPGLYMALVKRTIEAFEKFGDKCSFTVSGKKFDTTVLEKLKMHEFALGIFVS